MAAGFGRHGMPPPASNDTGTALGHGGLERSRDLATLTFDLLILKLVCESHQRWITFLPNLDTLGLWVLELFAMYATDGQTDEQTRAMPIAPSPAGGGIKSHSAPGMAFLSSHVSAGCRYSGINVRCSHK